MPCGFGWGDCRDRVCLNHGAQLVSLELLLSDGVRDSLSSFGRGELLASLFLFFLRRGVENSFFKKRPSLLTVPLLPFENDPTPRLDYNPFPA